MLKPAGTLSLAVGSLSGAAAIGGGATGASFAAASLAGRPISGEPGGSAGAAVAAGAGSAGCCATAAGGNTPTKTPASKRLRGADDQIIMTFLPLSGSLMSLRGRAPAQGGFPRRHSPIFLPRRAIGKHGGAFRGGPKDQARNDGVSQNTAANVS